MGSLTAFNLTNFVCDVYVETGTGRGDCLWHAISSGRFSRYYSVDLDQELVDQARDLFPLAQIDQGLSVERLEYWLKNELKQEDQVLFFLDAHFPNADFRGAAHDVKAPHAVPLEEELRLIKQYRPLCRDVIICDDARIYQIGPWQGGNVEWLQVPGGLNFLYELYSEDRVSFDYRNEGYIIIDNR